MSAINLIYDMTPVNKDATGMRIKLSVPIFDCLFINGVCARKAITGNCSVVVFFFIIIISITCYLTRNTYRKKTASYWSCLYFPILRRSNLHFKMKLS